ncbi:type III-A CRISPR-associated RAMP protein Csm3 [Fibrisoma montanum]|uniref:CRISPR system Cms endoribonuclease Csm3 n=1 Tax=Fibrisoma montanum TaxID=2305895 RepID=A0A418MFK8_9BACT|nr:type III-A CRISPR-associated RAMP protein Csm3 [Fibrisoma montanum]RIV25580.1 type III-A CRISPR-associated RAMP protein Csm3 [Fibrisoma montanum]
MKLLKKILITGEIEALTGLMIGGSNTAMGIGGPDKMVIRNPVTKQPYVPGSSVKGKMRSLLEVSFGYIGEKAMGKVKNGPGDNPDHQTTVLFGSARGDDRQRPSRIICRDGFLLNPDDLKGTELPFTEAKTEVVIDRITSAAMPRTFERVPAGARFGLNIVVNVFDDDKFKDDLRSLTYKALQLLQDDYLGGSGSRGNGQVKIRIQSVVERTSEFYQGTDKDQKILTLDEAKVPQDLR